MMIRIPWNTSRTAVLAVGLVVGVFVMLPKAYAGLSLAARFLQGGMDLDFGRIEVGTASASRELEISMTSTGGDGQYRLYQEVSGFLTNQSGVRLPEGSVVFQLARGLSGTPSSGAILPLTEFPQELYVSNANGDSDSLVIAYSIAGNARPEAGNYRGVLRFTLESRQSGVRTTTSINVRLAVAAIVELERSPISISQLRFNGVDLGQRSEPQDFSFKIKNNATGEAKLIQELIEPLTGIEGQYFPAEAVQYMVTSSQGASAWQAVSNRPEEVISDKQGDVSDVRLSYAVSVPMDQRAGVYRGKIRLRLLGSGVLSADQWTVPVEVEVREVFKVSVLIVDGSEELRFRRDAAGSSATEQVMRVTVTTNTGKPYQVLAGLDHSLVLATGESLPASSMTWLIEEAKQGKPLVAPASPVAIGFEPIFQSDSSGASDSFILRYKMSIPSDARDGTYSSRLHFTVTVF